jgi:hypothetical protein
LSEVELRSEGLHKLNDLCAAAMALNSVARVRSRPAKASFGIDPMSAQ